MRCPRCGCKVYAPIVYGMPVMDDLLGALDRKELALGNGFGVPNSPKYECHDCGFRYGSAPLYIKEDLTPEDLEPFLDYRTETTSFHYHFQISRSPDFAEITIEKAENDILIRITPLGAFERVAEQSISENKWDEFLETIFSKLLLHEWGEEYCDANVLDGTQWTITYIFAGKTLEICGSNMFGN